jgi:hypothetical protein
MQGRLVGIGKVVRMQGMGSIHYFFLKESGNQP